MADMEWMTADEVATAFRVPPATVRRWLRDGQLRGVRLGGTRAGWRIARTDVDAFVTRGYADAAAAADARKNVA